MLFLNWKIGAIQMKKRKNRWTILYRLYGLFLCKKREKDDINDNNICIINSTGFSFTLEENIGITDNKNTM